MRYVVITEVPLIDPNSGEEIAANTVINAIVWDGVTPYDPGPNLRLVQSDTLQVGDMASS